MKTINETESQIISVHFDDNSAPTKMTFSTVIDGKVKVLADQGCDVNDLEDIKGMAINGPYRSNVEYLFNTTYDVRNSSFGTPFEL